MGGTRGWGKQKETCEPIDCDWSLPLGTKGMTLSAFQSEMRRVHGCEAGRQASRLPDGLSARYFFLQPDPWREPLNDPERRPDAAKVLSEYLDIETIPERLDQHPFAHTRADRSDDERRASIPRASSISPMTPMTGRQVRRIAQPEPRPPRPRCAARCILAPCGGLPWVLDG